MEVWKLFITQSRSLETYFSIDYQNLQITSICCRCQKLYIYCSFKPCCSRKLYYILVYYNDQICHSRAQILAGTTLISSAGFYYYCSTSLRAILSSIIQLIIFPTTLFFIPSEQIICISMMSDRSPNYYVFGVKTVDSLMLLTLRGCSSDITCCRRILQR